MRIAICFYATSKQSVQSNRQGPDSISGDTDRRGGDNSMTETPRLVMPTHPELRALARRLAPVPADADDLAQEATIAAWRAGDHATERTAWLAGVVRNRAVSRWRAESRRRRREEACPVPLASPSPERTAEVSQQLRALADALERLDETERQLVIARFYEERSAKELARELGVPASTIRSRLSRAVGRLRDDLGVEAQPLRARLSAWLLLPLGALRRNPARIAMTSTTLKAGIVGATVLAAAATAWIAHSSPRRTARSSAASIVEARPSKGPQRPASAATPTPAAPGERTASAPLVETPRDDDGDRRRVLRERLNEARAQRDRLPVPVANADAREYLQTIMATNRQIAEQMEIFDDCFDAQPGRTQGLLQLEADLIGEAEVGMLFDDVTLTQDTVEDEALAECVRESLRSVELEAPQRAYYQHYRYTFDWASGKQQVHAIPTEAQVEEIRASFPEIDDGPYATLVDDEPDGVAFGLMPGRRGDPVEP